MDKKVVLPVAEGVAIVALAIGLFAKGNVDQQKIAQKESEIQGVQEQLVLKDEELASLSTVKDDYTNLQSEYAQVQSEKEELAATVETVESEKTAIKEAAESEKTAIQEAAESEKAAIKEAAESEKAAILAETDSVDTTGSESKEYAETDTSAAATNAEVEKTIEEEQTTEEEKTSETVETWEFDSEAATLLIAEKDSLIAEKESAIAEKDSLLEKKDSLIAEKDSAIAEKDSKLEEKDNTIAEKDSAIAEKDNALAEKDSQLAAKDSEFEEKEAQYQKQAEELQAQITELLTVRDEIIDELEEVFEKSDLPVSVNEDTGVITVDSGVLFDFNSSALTESGLLVLDEVLTKYYDVISSDDVNQYISEVIIEGHTDDEGDYLYNLYLSQKRAFAVADYFLDPESKLLTEEQAKELGKIITVNGKAFSEPVLDEKGEVDDAASRRVELEFRLLSDDLLTQKTE